MSKLSEEQSALKQWIEHVAKERGISRAEMISMLEHAIREAAKKAVRNYQNVDAKIDDKANITCFAKLNVVETVVDPSLEIDLKVARTKIPNAKVGDEIDWEIQVQDFGRIASQFGRQALNMGLHEAEKRHVVSMYKNQEGQLLTGKVARKDKNGVWIDLGNNVEGLMPPKSGIPGEQYNEGDTITVLLKTLNSDKPGASLFVTRSSTEFVRKLFEREVSEISDGTVEIKGIAREPGYRTKIAVYSSQEKVDPVGACVGVRGARVRMIVSELGGEKVDIINYSPDIRVFTENALKPAKLAKVFISEHGNEKILEVRVTDDQLSLSIGKKGQNARLAAKLLGWKINIEKLVQEEGPKDPSMEDLIEHAAEVLATATGTDISVGRILVANGFHSIEGLREATMQDLTEIDGIDEEIAAKIIAAVSL